MWKKWKKGESVLEQLVISFSLPQPRVGASLGVCVLSFTLHFFFFFTSIYPFPGLLFLFSFLLPVCVASFSTSLAQC